MKTETTQHTPGPWMTMDLPCAPWPRTILFVRTPDGGHKELASIEHTETEEGMANARLIATAPAMLELVRRIAERYELEQRVGPDARVEGIMHEEGQAARALLRAIEGE